MHLNCVAKWLDASAQAGNPTSCPACRARLPPLEAPVRSSDEDTTTDTTDTTDDDTTTDLTMTTTDVADTDATTDDEHERRIDAVLVNDQAVNMTVADRVRLRIHRAAR